MEINEELQELELKFDRNFDYLEDSDHYLGITLTLDDICLKILIPGDVKFSCNYFLFPLFLKVIFIYYRRISRQKTQHSSDDYGSVS